MKIIVYDEENMKYLEGNVENIEVETNFIDYRDDKGMSHFIPYNNVYTIAAYNMSDTETIKLDETMMKRILKFNKDIEIKNIDKQIQHKKEKIEELDDFIQDKTKRIEKLKKFVEKLYELDIEQDDDEYCWEE